MQRRIPSMLSSQLNPWLMPLLHMIEFHPHCVRTELLRKRACDQREPSLNVLRRSLSGKIPSALANIAVGLRFFAYGYAFGRAAAVTLRCVWQGICPSALSRSQQSSYQRGLEQLKVAPADCGCSTASLPGLWLYISPANALPVCPTLICARSFSACTWTIHIANNYRPDLSFHCKVTVRNLQWVMQLSCTQSQHEMQPFFLL